jgi:hypothetical protein
MEAANRNLTPDTEVAWAAGFFDGEGHTCCARQTATGRALQMCVSQVNRDNLQRFVAVVGCGTIHAARALPNRKPISKWAAYGAKAQRALQVLWPYLGSEKREQALDALTEWALRPVNKSQGFCIRGHRLNEVGRRSTECLICGGLRRRGLPRAPLRPISALSLRLGMREYDDEISVKPGFKTCSAAVAWSFGLTSAQYKPSVET